jgi:hypothetical protein
MLRHGDISVSHSRTLCGECRRFARLARYGTRCPLCRSDDIVYTTERTGQETLFCATCDYIWTRMPSSDNDSASSLIMTAQRTWFGVERRLAMRTSMRFEPSRRRAS